MESKLSAAGFNVTTVTGDELDLVTNMYAAYLLRLTEFAGDRETIDAYTLKLGEDSMKMLEDIITDAADIVDDSGTTTDAPGMVSYNVLPDNSAFRDTSGDFLARTCCAEIKCIDFLVHSENPSFLKFIDYPTPPNVAPS